MTDPSKQPVAWDVTHTAQGRPITFPLTFFSNQPLQPGEVRVLESQPILDYTATRLVVPTSISCSAPRFQRSLFRPRQWMRRWGLRWLFDALSQREEIPLASMLDVLGISVDGEPQFFPIPLPATLFSKNAMAADFRCKPCPAGRTIALKIQNGSLETIPRIHAVIFGTVDRTSFVN